MKEPEDCPEMNDILYSWIRRIHAIKMYILCQTIHRFNVILIKMPMTFCTRKNTTKIEREPQKL